MDFQFKNKLGLKSFGVSTFVSAVLVFLGSSVALAAEGQPVDWQLGFQDSVTPIMDQINEFHNLLLIIITVITLFVMALLLYVMLRFSAKANPVPSKTTHSTSLEFAWTVVPILILLVISVPSWRLLNAQYSFPKAAVTIKALGNQWNWDYEYSDHEDISFTASMKEDSELIEPAVHCFSASRHLERIADLAENVAEDVIYLVEGEIVRHKHGLLFDENRANETT